MRKRICVSVVALALCLVMFSKAGNTGSFWVFDLPAPNALCWANLNWSSTPAYPVYRICYKPWKADGDACDYHSQITSHNEICLEEMTDNTIYRIYFYGWSTKKEKWKKLYKMCAYTHFVELKNGMIQRQFHQGSTCKKYKKYHPDARQE